MRDIAAKTAIKRPTIYLHIEELTRHHLVHLVRVGKRTHYIAAHPSSLMKLAERTTTTLQNHLPHLTSLYDASHHNTSESRISASEVNAAIAFELTETDHLYLWSSSDFYTQEFVPQFSIPKRITVVHVPAHPSDGAESPILIFDRVTMFLHRGAHGFTADRVIGRDVALRMRQLMETKQK
jgi:DNA-binding transcriptional ArsR family regulator